MPDRSKIQGAIQGAIIVMGVSGCGKSLVGKLIAEALDARFLEADNLHPKANIEKMASGIPLTDDDRVPWLEEVTKTTAQHSENGGCCVTACSALRKGYRDILRRIHADTTFVYLKGSRELILSRMKARTDHFMPSILLDSQFATLESPENEDNVVVVSIDASPEAIAKSANQKLQNFHNMKIKNI